LETTIFYGLSYVHFLGKGKSPYAVQLGGRAAPVLKMVADPIELAKHVLARLCRPNNFDFSLPAVNFPAKELVGPRSTKKILTGTIHHPMSRGSRNAALIWFHSST